MKIQAFFFEILKNSVEVGLASAQKEGVAWVQVGRGQQRSGARERRPVLAQSSLLLADSL
jgi:hypothetical protein